MAKPDQPYRKWVANCPDKECAEQLEVELDLEWIWCPLCEKDWDLNVDPIRDEESKTDITDDELEFLYKSMDKEEFDRHFMIMRNLKGSK